MNADNNFKHLAELGNVEWSSENEQTLKITHADGFHIMVLIPDGIFEWFITVYDTNNNEIASDWYDHYEGDKTHRMKERQEEVEKFVREVSGHKARFIRNRKRFQVVSSFQIFKDNHWTDVIRTTKLKFW